MITLYFQYYGMLWYFLEWSIESLINDDGRDGDGYENVT